MFSPRFLLSLPVSLPLASFAFASDGPTLEQRLESLAERLEAARVEAHIPGMSIAIVKDDEIVWARGFGLADVAAQRPADEHTIYAIGSTTKAFTATLVGMLVDEGKASWDDPITRYLPYFDLAVRSDDENAECTLRDLLSHRHGFSRMGILWFGGQVSREAVLRTAAGAEPWDDFRAGFHYCNVTYLAAGEAAGVAGGSSWDELMVERIFEPLEMTSSTLTVTEAQKDARLALGYEWDDTDQQFEHQEMVSLDNISPAGAVNSNVLDMAQWIRLQLGQGELDGQRLISTDSIRATWSPQIEMAPGASYGLGWMLSEHDGRKVVEHGGAIDGFSAQVSLMPEEKLGYVLLMNLSAAPLREPSLELVFDALLDKRPKESAEDKPTENAVTAVEPVDFEDYVGIYIANFASFRDEPFEILINGDHLALDIPSQQKTDLELPDQDGKWISTLTDQLALSFDRDERGAVIGLKIHTDGFQFEVPREGVEVQPEVPVAELEKYVGTYVRAVGGRRDEISIEGGRLVYNVKNKRMPLHTPDADGFAALRARADQGVTFKTDPEGEVESYVFHGDAGDQLFTRLADASDPSLPTLDEVLALRDTEARLAALNANGGSRSSGEVWIAQAGVRGTVTVLQKGSDRYASHMDFGKFGRIDVVARGKQAWSYNSMRGFDVLKGDELTQAQLGHPGAVEGDWTDYFDTVEVVRNDSVNDRPVHVIRLRKGDLPSRTYWIDAEYGDVLRIKLVMIEGPMRLPLTTTYSEFKEFGGLRRAMRAEIENPESGRTVLMFEEVDSDLQLGDELFALEDPGGQGKAK